MPYSELYTVSVFFSLSSCDHVEAGGAFSYQQTGLDSSGVLGAGGLGDGTLSPWEYGHATLPQTGAAGLDWTWWRLTLLVWAVAPASVCVCVRARADQFISCAV